MYTNLAKSTHAPESPGGKAALWQPDYTVSSCMNCATHFNSFIRRHHCRGCGKIVCGRCSENRMILPNLSATKPVRVCITCYRSEKRNFKQLSSSRLSWLCESDSDSDIEDVSLYYLLKQSLQDEVQFERHHRSNRIHGI